MRGLIDRLKVESLLNTIKDVVDSEDPNKALSELTKINIWQEETWDPKKRQNR